VVLYKQFLPPPTLGNIDIILAATEMQLLDELGRLIIFMRLLILTVFPEIIVYSHREGELPNPLR
jgi:hypothetical protein